MNESECNALAHVMDACDNVPDPQFVRSDVIKQEYLESACQSSDVYHAINRLMSECGDLFENDRAAWEFLMEEPHEDNEQVGGKNTNCLVGMKCPSCGNLGPYQILATSMFTVSDSGTDEYANVEWSGDSLCICMACRHNGTVEGFKSTSARVSTLTEDETANLGI